MPRPPAGTTFCLRVKSPSQDNSIAAATFSTIPEPQEFSTDSGLFYVETGKSLIPHYYRTLLSRPYDSKGRENWEGELWRMIQGRADQIEGYRALAFAFLNSAEYSLRNRRDAQFVGDLYNAFFNRTASSGEIDGWTTLIPTISRTGVTHHFLHSQEFENFMLETIGINGEARAEVFAIVDFYRGFFRRLPDPSGMVGWVDQYQIAQCQTQDLREIAIKETSKRISSGFLRSAEYVSSNRTNAEYVVDLYSAFLRRGAEIDGFTFWKKQLDDTILSREQVMNGFIQSSEFRSRMKQVLNAGCKG